MDAKNLELAKAIVDDAYIDQATEARHRIEKLIRILLTQRKIPDRPWTTSTIELFLHELSMMDSNNFIENVGFGERESRVFSSIVQKRHFHLGHGIGRAFQHCRSSYSSTKSGIILK